MKKSKYLLFILFLLLTGCRKDLVPVPSWTDWTKYSGNPVMVPETGNSWDTVFVGLGSVIFHNNIYHIWYTGGGWHNTNFSIGHATSPDGITWTKDINNPVLGQGSAGSWDENSPHSPHVIVINNVFHMWYTGHRGKRTNCNFQIGHATSADGTTWTKDPNNPVLTVGSAGTWDKSWVSVGTVLNDGTKYHMWYTGCDTLTFGVRIGHATSADGLTWAKDALNPVLDIDIYGIWDNARVDFPSVSFDGTYYNMLFTGGELYASKIGYAKSVDGSNWTKSSANPVLIPGKSGSWDYRSVAGMSMIDSAGVKYKLWYWGSKTALTGSIGYAVALPH
jgi:predicted GH43/DUF377 family glycosyl hydrolase